MVHIQDLPIEILNHILSFIFYPKYESFEKLPEGADEGEKPKGVTAEELKRGDRHDDENDDVNVTLLNLCLVSRLFRDLAQPVLFHDFEEDGWTEDISKTISFTRSI
ncbi:hypothetical protein BGW36DRAFT_426240 [Talaromyces proteolyticus]|uniref:F-box domain-containing protein n=1 Tax=Talaromyces proteolyticus TaxID=1131652 RepID=A0AAD4KWM5_9EURO|nr:uncharacterized protein BGW36DRAFT_426240 [Talaromyces proteolyticus]KAH8698538.1 hypothetical protein BGW36DRAFT_426240 [Talaromyces proteolyticus]